MENKTQLDEASAAFKDLKRSWEEKARAATVETLPQFLAEITENYEHDYGTICHAVAAASLAAANAVNHSPQGGITGFQADCIMWEFIRLWNHASNKCGLRLVNYDNMLYPQYAKHFEGTLSPSVWAALQKEAATLISDADNNYTKYLLEYESYKKAIHAFIDAHPDYLTDPEYYAPLGMGTAEDWKREEEKKASGFEFAPQPPYCHVTKESRVYQHWQSIVDGVVPFGYTVAHHE